jgi:hypothetical protein
VSKPNKPPFEQIVTDGSPGRYAGGADAELTLLALESAA